MIWLLPTIGLLVTSFRPRGDIQNSGWWTTFGSFHLTLENYQQVLNAQGMGQAFLNSLFIAIPSTLLPLAGLLAGRLRLLVDPVPASATRSS